MESEFLPLSSQDLFHFSERFTNTLPIRAIRGVQGAARRYPEIAQSVEGGVSFQFMSDLSNGLRVFPLDRRTNRIHIRLATSDVSANLLVGKPIGKMGT